MKITKDFPGLGLNANGTYVYPGDLISYDDIEVELDTWLTVRGNVLCDGDVIVKKQITIEGDLMVAGNATIHELSASGSVVIGGSLNCEWLNAIKGVICSGNKEGCCFNSWQEAESCKRARIIVVKISILFRGSEVFTALINDAVYEHKARPEECLLRTLEILSRHCPD